MTSGTLGGSSSLAFPFIPFLFTATPGRFAALFPLDVTAFVAWRGAELRAFSSCSLCLRFGKAVAVFSMIAVGRRPVFCLFVGAGSDGDATFPPLWWELSTRFGRGLPLLLELIANEECTGPSPNFPFPSRIAGTLVSPVFFTRTFVGAPFCTDRSKGFGVLACCSPC
jgi:hypothetical protein